MPGDDFKMQIFQKLISFSPSNYIIFLLIFYNISNDAAMELKDQFFEKLYQALTQAVNSRKIIILVGLISRTGYMKTRSDSITYRRKIQSS